MSSRTSARIRRFVTVVAAACLAAVTLMPSGAGAAIVASVPLATAAEYAVLAGSTVTNTGASVLNGSLGLDPGTSVTGFPPGIVVPPATTDVANGAAQQAKSDLVLAYDNAAGRPLIGTGDGATPADLAKLSLVGGVYATSGKGALLLSGPLTLDGANDPDSVFIFQTDATLTAATGSTVNLINGAQACNVFWQVGSSATLSGSTFVGNILAMESITVNNSVTVQGRALARTSAVTLDTDVFDPPVCATQQSTTTTTSTTSTTSTTAPATTTTAAPLTTPTTAPAAPPVGSGGGTATGAPTGRTTTSSATPSTPRPVLPRTGSALGLTALLGLTLVALGSGAVRLGRRDS